VCEREKSKMEKKIAIIFRFFEKNAAAPRSFKKQAIKRLDWGLYSLIFCNIIKGSLKKFVFLIFWGRGFSPLVC